MNKPEFKKTGSSFLEQITGFVGVFEKQRNRCGITVCSRRNRLMFITLPPELCMDLSATY